jgi:hypothetical protein
MKTSFNAQPQTTSATQIAKARHDLRATSGDQPSNISRHSPRKSLAVLKTFNLTNHGNAEAFVMLPNDTTRFDQSRGKWLTWNDRHWE